MYQSIGSISNKHAVNKINRPQSTQQTNASEGCEFHRVKIQKLSKELNEMIESNLRIREQNLKLRQLNTNLSNKIEEKNLVLRQHISNIKLDQETKILNGQTPANNLNLLNPVINFSSGSDRNGTRLSSGTSVNNLTIMSE
jgi:hypothetical protein